MTGRLQSFSRRLLTGGACLMFLASAALGESGYLLVIKDQSGGAPTIRKVKNVERKSGFYLSQSYGGTTEKLDAMYVGAAIELSSLEPKNIDDVDDINNLKAVEATTSAAIKQYPQLAPQLTPPLTQLRADIARAELGNRRIDGTWLTPEQVAIMNGKKASTIHRGSLHLKNGVTYDNVDIVSANPKELKIFHASGAATIPMSLVPEDFIKKNLPPSQQAAANPKP